MLFLVHGEMKTSGCITQLNQVGSNRAATIAMKQQELHISSQIKDKILGNGMLYAGVA